jgi:hypothetical protein
MIATPMHEPPGSRALRNRTLAIGLALAALVAASGCGEHSASRIAAGALEKYRKTSGAKPLPASGMMRLRLAAPADRPPAAGLDEVLWETRRYRESVSSAGLTTIRGIESGKAYFTDQDGVTRVASDQFLRELTTRSYFWRRAWLFEERERAWLDSAREDATTVSVSLRPEGGNPLTLTFSRADGRLLAARSPRFALEFTSPRAFRDVSDPRNPFDGEIAWVGLPTGPIVQAYAGGGQSRFGAAAADGAPFERRSGALTVPAAVLGRTVRLAIDASADGPVVLSPELAGRLGLVFAPDVFGRFVAPAASLEVAGVVYPSLWVQRSSEPLPGGADAMAGGCLFREAAVEFDPEAGRLRLHDSQTWSAPEGYFRIVIDDDEDRPVAILNRGKSEVRLAAGSDTGEAAIVLAAASAEREGLAGANEATGFTWGLIHLPALPMTIARDGFDPDWGDDGRLGFAVLLRFHAFVNMPERWIYVKAVAP